MTLVQLIEATTRDFIISTFKTKINENGINRVIFSRINVNFRVIFSYFLYRVQCTGLSYVGAICSSFFKYLTNAIILFGKNLVSAKSQCKIKKAPEYLPVFEVVGKSFFGKYLLGVVGVFKTVLKRAVYETNFLH